MECQKMRKTIYNNNNLQDDYEKDAREYLESINEPTTEENIWNEIYNINENNLRDAKQNLEEFFEEGTWILRGTVNRWDGAYQAGTIFTDIISTFNKMIKGCDYIHIYSENGHLYFQCTHHDGVNIFEIKKLTEKGERYFEN